MFESGNASAMNIPAQDARALTSVFEQIKGTLRKEYGDTVFRTWLHPVQFTSFDSGILSISVPTRFIRDWVRTHYADRLRLLWTQHAGTCLRVDMEISGKTPAAATPFEPANIANENASDIAVDALSSPLDPRFTFENFIVAASNELAYAAAKRVAESDTVPFNPLYLQGGVGFGKTHLMQSVAHALRARHPGKNVVYMSAEKFMYQFVRAIRAKDTVSFKEQFRAIDILMIDDLQFICGKESTQQEFFHTFNALVDQGKQVILTSDRAPAELEAIDDRLRSRLGMGLVANIQNASYETRLAILKSKCALMNRKLPEDVLSFLAEKVTANVRELEGALNRLIAHTELINRSITLPVAQDILQDLLRANDRRITIEDIQKQVAEYFGIRVADILSPRRARNLARPRQIAMFLSKALTQHSLPEIGRKFGGRDHTTIIHGVRKVEELMAAETSFRSDVETLKRALAA
jgi:chromosomal replication initiator protein